MTRCRVLARVLDSVNSTTVNKQTNNDNQHQQGTRLTRGQRRAHRDHNIYTAYITSRAQSHTEETDPKYTSALTPLKLPLAGSSPQTPAPGRSHQRGPPTSRPAGLRRARETPSCVRTGNNQIAWLKIASVGLRAGSPSPPFSSLLPSQSGTQAGCTSMQTPRAPFPPTPDVCQPCRQPHCLGSHHQGGVTS